MCKASFLFILAGIKQNHWNYVKHWQDKYPIMQIYSKSPNYKLISKVKKGNWMKHRTIRTKSERQTQIQKLMDQPRTCVRRLPKQLIRVKIQKNQPESVLPLNDPFFFRITFTKLQEINKRILDNIHKG